MKRFHEARWIGFCRSKLNQIGLEPTGGRGGQTLVGLGGQAVVVAEEGGVGRRLNEVEGVVQERFVDLAS